jgi:2-C-methyl-D-erythritol 2,4-cyclodiphosphate synthase
MRIGQGIDVHAFCPGDHITIGGVKIDFHLGIRAHSDGDVLLHALCDALLGAAGLGDIGRHFPDTDSQFKSIDSRILLQEVNKKITAKKFQIVNTDMTLIAEQPKFAKHIQQMEKNISDDLKIAVNQINIKATTTEKMGFCGRQEGIAAMAIVLLS